MVKCLNCDSEIDENRYKFCSKYCKIKYHSINRKKFKEGEIRICPICKIQFKIGELGHSQIYCSKKCRKKSVRLRNHERYRKEWRENYENNAEKIKDNARKNYIKNKEHRLNKAKEYRAKNYTKWRSREITYDLLNLKRKKILIIKECKICKDKNNLEIHHEIYPTKKEEIIQAIKEDKIYYLCRKHHKMLSRRYK